MTFIAREEPFVCENCGHHVLPLGKGTYRDHCPKCLTSKHVDRDGPGDRLSACKSLLIPTHIDHDGKKGTMIVYQCAGCSKVSRNRAAPDDDIISFAQDIHKIV